MSDQNSKQNLFIILYHLIFKKKKQIEMEYTTQEIKTD